MLRETRPGDFYPPGREFIRAIPGLFSNLLYHIQSIGPDGDQYLIRSNQSNLPLDVYGCNTANGTVLQQWADNNTSCQRFRLNMHNNALGGTWFIQSVLGPCADNAGGSSANGNQITMWGMDRYSANQHWPLTDNSRTNRYNKLGVEGESTPRRFFYSFLR